MGVFEHFPYANMHEMNLDWLLKKMKELAKVMETFKATESLKFADPIIWDITTQYEKSTIVLDPTGNAYLSLQAVPAGVQLNNDEYWLEIFNFTEYTRTANQNLTVNTERDTTRATATYQVDDWLIWNDVLYRVTAPIAIDDALIVAPAAGSNIVHFTVEDFIKAFITYATGLIQQYKNDIDASELAYRQQLAGDIQNTTASLQAQLDAAIAGVTVDSEVINARIGADGITYATLGDAIRTQFTHVYDEFTSIMDGELIPLDASMFELGSYSVTIGSAPTKVSQTNRIRISEPIFIKGVNRIIMKPTTGYLGMFAVLDSNGIAIMNRSYTHNEFMRDLTNLTDPTYLIVGLRRTDNANMTTAEYNNVDYSAIFQLQSDISDNKEDIESLKNISIGSFTDLGSYQVGEIDPQTDVFDPTVVRKLSSAAFIPYDENLVIFNNTIGRTPEVHGYVVIYDNSQNIIPRNTGNNELENLYFEMSTLKNYNPSYFKLCLLNMVAGDIPQDDVRTITRNVWCANKTDNLTQLMIASFDGKINNLKKNSLIKSVAHQGYHAIYTPNTTDAIRAAGLKGYDYAEFDVRLSSDNVLIIQHDNELYVNPNTMKFTSSSDPDAVVYRLNEHTYSDISSYTYPNPANPTATIPTLEEMLQACKKYGVKPYIEIVGAFGQVPQMCDLVKKYGLTDDAVFSTGTSPAYYHPLILQQIPDANIALQLAPLQPFIDVNDDIIATNGTYHYLYEHVQDGYKSIVRIFVSQLAPGTTFSDVIDFIEDLRAIDINVSMSRVDTQAMYEQYGFYSDYVLSNVYKSTEIFT